MQQIETTEETIKTLPVDIVRSWSRKPKHSRGVGFSSVKSSTNTTRRRVGHVRIAVVISAAQNIYLEDIAAKEHKSVVSYTTEIIQNHIDCEILRGNCDIDMPRYERENSQLVDVLRVVLGIDNKKLPNEKIEYTAKLLNIDTSKLRELLILTKRQSLATQRKTEATQELEELTENW